MSLSQEQIDRAYWFWLRDYLAVTRAINCGSLKRVRRSMMKTAETVADSMGVSVAAYQQIERGERAGSVRLSKMEKAAEAMGCEFLYVIIPKNRDGERPKDFSERIWDEIWPEAVRHPRVANAFGSQNQTRALAAAAIELMNSPRFRRRKGWTIRKDG